MKHIHTCFYLLSISILLILISPFFLSEGMFFDGVIYASIARNIAIGHGSFWDLHFSESLFNHYIDHPPLAFGIQSLFFSLFGDSVYIEKIYSLSTFIITGVIMTKIWKQIQPSNFHAYTWIPLLFWVINPLISWCVPNNTLENSMMIFTNLAILFALKGLEKNYFNLFISGLFLFLAFLCKGFPGLFPIVIPTIYFIVTKSINLTRTSNSTLVILLGFILSFIVLFVIEPNALIWFKKYISLQVMHSIQHERTVDTRFFILLRLLSLLIPAGILIVLLYLRTFKYKVSIDKNIFLFLLITSLCGILPIMISIRQSGYYMLAATPLLSLSLATFTLPRIHILIPKLIPYTKPILYTSISILAIAITLNLKQINTIGRDHSILSTVKSSLNYIPKNSKLLVNNSTIENYTLHAYYRRLGRIILISDTTIKCNFQLTKQDDLPMEPTQFTQIKNIQLVDFYLWKRISTTLP